MKRFIISSLALIALPLLAGAQSSMATTLDFQSVTTNAATVSFKIGSDTYGTTVQNRQPMEMKYRAVSKSEGLAPKLNGSETVIPLHYTLDWSNPFPPVALSGLTANQRYAIWLGHRAMRTCVSDQPCTAIYMNYDDASPFLFSTKLNAATIPTLSKALSFQSKSKDVPLLQHYLIANGYLKGPATNKFDIPTLVGVIKFQMANHLDTDGTVSTSSRTIINQWLLAQAQN